MRRLFGVILIAGGISVPVGAVGMGWHLGWDLGGAGGVSVAVGSGVEDAVPKFNAAGKLVDSQLSDDGDHVVVSAGEPSLVIRESDGSVNAKNWRFRAAGENFFFETGNDALSGFSQIFTSNRSGTVSFPNGVSFNVTPTANFSSKVNVTRTSAFSGSMDQVIFSSWTFNNGASGVGFNLYVYSILSGTSLGAGHGGSVLGRTFAPAGYRQGAYGVEGRVDAACTDAACAPQALHGKVYWNTASAISGVGHGLTIGGESYSGDGTTPHTTNGGTFAGVTLLQPTGFSTHYGFRDTWAGYQNIFTGSVVLSSSAVAFSGLDNVAARKSGNQSVTQNVITNMAWGTEDFDQTSAFNGTTVTVTANGRYPTRCVVQFSASAGACNLFAILKVNGAVAYTEPGYAPGSNAIAVEIDKTLILSAGDQVVCAVAHTDSGSLNALQNDASAVGGVGSWFELRREP